MEAETENLILENQKLLLASMSYIREVYHNSSYGEEINKQIPKIDRRLKELKKYRSKL